MISQSKGHPYIIKILLGEFGKTQNIKEILSKKDDMLTTLFERTYTELSPLAKQAFMTLASWNSTVPKIALEAVLICSFKDQNAGAVEEAIESLFNYSLAQINKGKDQQDFITLPFVARLFGEKKLRINPLKSKINDDVKLLQMFGSSNNKEISLNLSERLEKFIANISQKN